MKLNKSEAKMIGEFFLLFVAAKVIDGTSNRTIQIIAYTAALILFVLLCTGIFKAIQNRSVSKLKNKKSR